MNDDDSVLSRLNNLVEIADRTETCSGRERSIDPMCFVAMNEIASREVARREVVVTGDGDERPLELPRHVFDEACLAATRRSLEHHGEAALVTFREDVDLVAARQV